MTGSVWVDLAVIALAVLAAISGYRQGAVASALAVIGVLLGAFAGILLVPHVISRFDDRQMRLLVGIGLLVLLVIIGEVAGMILGRAARSGIRSRGLRTVDSGVGLVLQAVAVLVAAWLLSIPLSKAATPSVATAVDDSRVLGVVDDVAPTWLREMPAREFGPLLGDSGLPEVIGPFVRAPVSNVDPPDPAILRLPAVAQARQSVVKIEGVAPSCRQALEGSGFAVASERIITNAHVVAGTTRLQVMTNSGRRLAAEVVLFDSGNDIAVLQVPNLNAEPLRFATRPAESAEDGIVLGYPENGPFDAEAVRVREMINLSGPNIYRTSQVTREVYTIRGQIRQGNSGGPMLNSEGDVLGVVFGAAENPSDQTGFVLTARQVQNDFNLSEDRDGAVDTGTCVRP
ncbi:acid resistance serine protease MarP [Gordonia sinesedis]